VRKDGLEQVLVQGAGPSTLLYVESSGLGQANLVVSLVGIHKGEWSNRRELDGKEVETINAYFEDGLDLGEPFKLMENAQKVFQGVIILGEGFLLTHDEAETMKEREKHASDVIFPVINGQEVNSHPEQLPGRQVINFFRWSRDEAAEYRGAFARVEQLVKPVRARDNRAIYRDNWWQYAEERQKLTRNLEASLKCFVAARTTKYLNFSAMPTNYVFTDALYVFTTDRWDLYAVAQSTLHGFWARKYSGALETRLRYSPSDCFETFPFPGDLWQLASLQLAEAGERYHEHRRSLMRQLWLGLTDIYNLFHARDLTPALVAKVSKKSDAEAEAGYAGLLELRRLHVALDVAVRDAYGWQDLDLAHGFVEVETLPETDRVRYTIAPDARKEVLRRLLALNHVRAVEEKGKMAEMMAADGQKKKREPKIVKEEQQPYLL
jgi:hypothetical protein